jgi:hypothetical protein
MLRRIRQAVARSGLDPVAELSKRRDRERIEESLARDRRRG